MTTEIRVRTEQPSHMELQYPARYVPAHKYAVGDTFGVYRVVELLGTTQYRLECQCGFRRVAKQFELPRLLRRGGTCAECKRNAERAQSNAALLEGGLNGWRVLRVDSRTGGRRLHLQCPTCERETTMQLAHAKTVACDHIRRGRRKAMAERRARGNAEAEARREADAPLIDLDRRWEHDMEAQVVVARMGPLTQVEVAALCGVSRQLIEQIEKRALGKIAGARAKLNPALKELYEHVSERPVGMWERMTDHMAVGSFRSEVDA